MILNKKGLVVLPLAALLFASCAKNISYEDAVKFVNENYTSKEKKTAKTVVELQGKAANKASEEVLKAMYPTLDSNLHYRSEDEIDAYVLDATTLDAMRTYYGTDGLTFSLKGKELTISFDGKMTFGAYNASEKDKNQYNSEGYPIKGYGESSVKTEDYDFSIVQTISYTY